MHNIPVKSKIKRKDSTAALLFLERYGQVSVHLIQGTIDKPSQ